MRIYSTQFLMNQFKAILSDLAYPLTITGRMKRYLNDYQIHGNSVQEGAPSPDTPIEVQSVGELVTEGAYAGKYKIPVIVTCGDTVKTTDIYLDEPLRKIGGYTDYIDFKGKRVIRNVGAKTFTGNEGWKVSTYNMFEHTSNLGYMSDITFNVLCLCSHYPSKNWSQCYNNRSLIGACRAQYYMRIRPYETCDTETLADWKAYLTEQYSLGTPVSVCYAIPTPTEETIELPPVLQFKGECTYTVETDISPSGIQVKYY